jgi:hypothetical protein
MSALPESNGDHMNPKPAAMYGLRDAKVMCELHPARDHALQEVFRRVEPQPHLLLRVEHRPSQ